MVVHPADKRPQVAERPLYLTSMRELKPFVNIRRVFDRPVVFGPFVDAGPVSPELRSGTDFLEQETVGLQPAWATTVDEIVGQLPGADLLAHDEAPIFEVGLVELDDGLQDMVFLRQMSPELVVPVVDGDLRQGAQASRLSNRDLLSPAPQ